MPTTARQGGSYAVEADGSTRLVTPPTPDHPDGNRARDAEGRPIRPGPTPIAARPRRHPDRAPKGE